MSKIINRYFYLDENGQALVEYTLIIAFVLLIGVLVLIGISGEVKRIFFENILKTIRNAVSIP